MNARQADEHARKVADAAIWDAWHASIVADSIAEDLEPQAATATLKSLADRWVEIIKPDSDREHIAAALADLERMTRITLGFLEGIPANEDAAFVLTQARDRLVAAAEAFR
ncbi:MAG: hypothetical protein R3F15_00780 [Lysobacterales bacterium]